VLGAIAGVDLFLVCHHAELQAAAIEALVKAVEEEARANGTLHLFERWKASLPVNPAERSAARASPRRRRTDAPG